MKLSAMAAEYQRQLETPAMDALSFEERVGMMTDAEWCSRENNRIKKLTQAANLRVSGACFADIDYRPIRKLDRTSMARLLNFAWVKEHHNIIITGATGTGKTWLACAFGTEACRAGLHVAFYRVSRLLNEMAVAIDAGSVKKLLAKIKKCNILILDDWGLTTLTPLEGRLLLEIFEDRYNEQSCIISAQLPVAKWHELFEDSTLADAVLDRIVHNSYRLELHGPSMRASVNIGPAGKDGAPFGEKNQNTYSHSDKSNFHQDGDSDV
jgi:DNA replication protein DnaC